MCRAPSALGWTAGEISMKYRMYVDEVGNPGLRCCQDPRHRYLSLTGVLMELSYVDGTVFPTLEGLKRRYFGGHADEPIILHRKELVNAAPPFHPLQDPATRARFGRELLELLDQLEYHVVTVVIDKLAHVEQYTVWRYDPYHYCMMVLLERFALWLERVGHQGDVMAESRGGKEDQRLKRSFEHLVETGSEHVSAERLATRLTSRQLKVKPKANNIAGLQLADLIAHPSFRAVLSRRRNEALPSNFGGRLGALLERRKYLRSPSGRIEGWGRKWLP